MFLQQSLTDTQCSLPHAHDVALGLLLEVGLHHPGRVLPVGHDAAGGRREGSASGEPPGPGRGCGRGAGQQRSSEAKGATSFRAERTQVFITAVGVCGVVGQSPAPTIPRDVGTRSGPQGARHGCPGAPRAGLHPEHRHPRLGGAGVRTPAKKLLKRRTGGEAAERSQWAPGPRRAVSRVTTLRQVPGTRVSRVTTLRQGPSTAV